MTTTDLDPRIFPYTFDCMDCPYGSTAEITHDEAVDAVPPGIEATPRQAVNRALLLREWYHDPRTGWMCSQCVEDLD